MAVAILREYVVFMFVMHAYIYNVVLTAALTLKGSIVHRSDTPADHLLVCSANNSRNRLLTTGIPVCVARPLIHGPCAAAKPNSNAAASTTRMADIFVNLYLDCRESKKYA